MQIDTKREDAMDISETSSYSQPQYPLVLCTEYLRTPAEDFKRNPIPHSYERQVLNAYTCCTCIKHNTFPWCTDVYKKLGYVEPHAKLSSNGHWTAICEKNSLLSFAVFNISSNWREQHITWMPTINLSSATKQCLPIYSICEWTPI